MSTSNPRNHRAWLGAALFVAVLTSATLIFFLDDVIEAARDTVTVIAVLDGAPHLREGAAVWIAGKPVGRVHDIGLLPNGETAHVAAAVRMPRRAREQIRADASARVTSDRLIGEPALDILPGSPTAPPLPPGDTVYAAAAMTLDRVLARTGALTAGIDSLAAAAAALTGPLARSVAAVSRMLDHAEAARDGFAVIAGSTDRGSLAILQDRAIRRAITSLRNAGHTLQARLDGAAKPHREVGAATRALRERIDHLVARLDTLDSFTAQGTIARFRNDAALAHAIDGVRAQLDSLIAEAKADPARFVF